MERVCRFRQELEEDPKMLHSQTLMSNRLTESLPLKKLYKLAKKPEATRFHSRNLSISPSSYDTKSIFNHFNIFEDYLLSSFFSMFCFNSAT